jgi:hypothetical protein
MAEKKKFLLRIDEDLWNDLAAWAADELRSVNSQIEYILKQAAGARAGRKKSAAPSLPRGGSHEES